jgi:lysophospholipase L1-like esterase
MNLSPNRFRVLFLVSLLLAACNPSPQMPMLAPDAVLLAFGNSLTHGTGAGSEKQSYPAVLAALSGHRVVNAGVPGEISSAGLTRLTEVLDEEQPSLLLLCHGGNDMLQKLDPHKTESNLRTMIREAQSRGIAVVLIGVPRPGLMLGTADLYKTIATDMNLPLEDEALSDILSQRKLKADPVHPNAAGYRQLAESVLALLKKHGAL